MRKMMLIAFISTDGIWKNNYALPLPRFGTLFSVTLRLMVSENAIELR